VLDPNTRLPPTSWGDLSARETEVLKMTALGMTNDEMAHRLAVTTHAVKFHLSSIYRKLGVANRTEAAAAFLTRT
jgi:DNA-binding CsgD family transcriptional regulator